MDGGHGQAVPGLVGHGLRGRATRTVCTAAQPPDGSAASASHSALWHACSAAALNYVAAWLRTAARGEDTSMKHAGGAVVPPAASALIAGLAPIANGFRVRSPVRVPRGTSDDGGGGSGGGGGGGDATVDAVAPLQDVHLAVGAALLHVAQVVVTREFDAPLFSASPSHYTPVKMATEVVAAVWTWLAAAAEKVPPASTAPAVVVDHVVEPVAIGAVLHSVAQFREGRLLLHRLLQLMVVLQPHVSRRSTTAAAGEYVDSEWPRLPNDAECRAVAFALLASLSSSSSRSRSTAAETSGQKHLCFRFLFAPSVVRCMLAARPRGTVATSHTSNNDGPTRAAARAGDGVSSDAVVAIRGILLRGAQSMGDGKQGGGGRGGVSNSTSRSLLHLPRPWQGSAQVCFLQGFQQQIPQALSGAFRVCVDWCCVCLLACLIACLLARAVTKTTRLRTYIDVDGGNDKLAGLVGWLQTRVAVRYAPLAGAAGVTWGFELASESMSSWRRKGIGVSERVGQSRSN